MSILINFIFRNKTIFWDIQNEIEEKQTGTERAASKVTNSTP